MCAQKVPDENWAEYEEQSEEYNSLWAKVRATLVVHEQAIVELEGFVDRMKALNARAKLMFPPEEKNDK